MIRKTTISGKYRVLAVLPPAKSAFHSAKLLLTDGAHVAEIIEWVDHFDSRLSICEIGQSYDWSDVVIDSNVIPEYSVGLLNLKFTVRYFEESKIIRIC